MKVSNNNRLYCHRKMTKTIKINRDGKGNTLHIPYDQELCVYAQRLREVYNYAVQFLAF